MLKHSSFLLIYGAIYFTNVRKSYRFYSLLLIYGAINLNGANINKLVREIKDLSHSYKYMAPYISSLVREIFDLSHSFLQIYGAIYYDYGARAEGLRPSSLLQIYGAIISSMELDPSNLWLCRWHRAHQIYGAINSRLGLAQLIYGGGSSPTEIMKSVAQRVIYGLCGPPHRDGCHHRVEASRTWCHH